MNLQEIFKKMPQPNCELVLDEDEPDEIRFGLRGAKGDSPDQDTRRSAKAIRDYIQEKHPDINFSYEFDDEWINITLKNKK